MGAFSWRVRERIDTSPHPTPHPTRAATLDCFVEKFLYLSVSVFRMRVYIYNQMENIGRVSLR